MGRGGQGGLAGPTHLLAHNERTLRVGIGADGRDRVEVQPRACHRVGLEQRAQRSAIVAVAGMGGLRCLEQLTV
eukprot:scaffold22279_cov123-Isochrysis_galbana.AAC.5